MPPVWKLQGGIFTALPPEQQGGTPSPYTLWGVLNLTPDSFFDGGRHWSLPGATAHAHTLIKNGARILDVGGSASHPGAREIPAQEEATRILPVIKELVRLRAETPELRAALISVDTWRATVAQQALEAGADIINDISACSWEPAMLGVVAEQGPGYVLMHCLPGRTPQNMQNEPSYTDVVEDVFNFFEKKMNMLVRAGLPEDHIILDPGIGFGKTLAHNCTLLAHIQRFLSLGRPVLAGISNKSFLGELLGLDVAQREEASAIATALLAARGVTHHRVHNAALARNALILTDQLTPRSA